MENSDNEVAPAKPTEECLHEFRRDDKDEVFCLKCGTRPDFTRWERIRKIMKGELDPRWAVDWDYKENWEEELARLFNRIKGATLDEIKEFISTLLEKQRKEVFRNSDYETYNEGFEFGRKQLKDDLIAKVEAMKKVPENEKGFPTYSKWRAYNSAISEILKMLDK